MATPEIVMYVLLLVFGTVLMHAVTKHRLSSRAGVARFRRFLSDKERRKLSDAQLRGRLLAIHASAFAWLPDALAMAGVLAAVLIARHIVGLEVGLSATLKHLLAFALIAAPVMIVAGFIRQKYFQAKLQAATP